MELNETLENIKQSNEEPLLLQNLQLLVLAELAITNNNSDEQMQMITQEDLLSDIEMLPRL
ncbi:24983_t:CDS:2 [Cetraspora pellucida]|uniref:24983_t:CDS:1 n=1 Tax=Cetraspora pellucida TaxID=1433469 RepID=A0A9N9AMU8_9GLOM|nr:24983_t:CDS:2 [Cetraspora pellucida]